MPKRKEDRDQAGLLGGTDPMKAYPSPIATADQHPSLAPVKDDPSLPRVLLVGDSISMGYTLCVRDSLTGVANVHRVPDNARFTAYGLVHLRDWVGDGRWDIIHFNWGLHDIRLVDEHELLTSPEEYARNLSILVKELRRTGARLIWCATTPVPDGPVDPMRDDKDVVRYNEIAHNFMHSMGVRVNDLYFAAKKNLSEIQIPHNVHFTEEGDKFLGRIVSYVLQNEILELTRF